MIYSYTQISQYLACPKRYQHRYVDGWKEKDTRAGMIFGRVFEHALAAYFRGEDAGMVLLCEWSQYQNTPLEYSKGETWERLAQYGIKLLDRFAQDDRVQVDEPIEDLQVKLTHSLSGGDQFVAYLDAIGKLNGIPCVLEWKTTSCRYPEEPEGLLALDPQLICYSWVSRMEEVALVAFIRKRHPEIQYLRTRITPDQQRQYGLLVESTVKQIEHAQFLPHSGIRFPQNGCLTCPYVGLCLHRQDLIESQLLQVNGGNQFEWLEQLDF